MANGLPYYKAYPRDFFEGTVGMPFELKSAYRLTLDLIYMQDGKLPDDSRYISGLLGCSVRKWNSIRKQLIEGGKISANLGVISNFRADKELIMSRTLRDKYSENASQRWKNNDLAPTTAMQARASSDTDTERREKEDTNVSSKKNAASAALQTQFNDWYSSYPHKVGKGAAVKAFAKAIKTTSLDDLKTGLQRYIETKPPDRSWCNPATWLNENRWLDEPAEIEGTENGSNGTLANWQRRENDERDRIAHAKQTILRAAGLGSDTQEAGNVVPILHLGKQDPS